jgi:S-adenosylmethionine synthetase
MARANYVFTSESVSEGHPDKVCDRISDEIVDLVYREAKKTGVDPWSVRIACETLATTNRVVIAGEVRVPPSLIKKDKNGHDTINPVKFKAAARKAIRDIGYEQNGFHWKTAKIDVLLHFQSAHIAQGVDNAADKQGSEGAGDQGIMFGYACNDTLDLMPAPIYYSHKILELLAAARHKGEGDAGKLGPDAKSQVTVHYSTASRPKSPRSCFQLSTWTPAGTLKKSAKLSSHSSAKRFPTSRLPMTAYGISIRLARL